MTADPATYRLTPGPRTITTACPHFLTDWLERTAHLSPAEARALATETLIHGRGEWGRVRLERLE